jgi:hypothetical protein
MHRLPHTGEYLQQVTFIFADTLNFPIRNLFNHHQFVLNDHEFPSLSWSTLVEIRFSHSYAGIE